MKRIQKRYFRIIILLITAALSASAGNDLKVVRTSSNSLDVQLANSEQVTGIQFCIHTSSGIMLKSVKPGTRTVNSSWSVDSYLANDSTVNILILNVNQQSLANGSGTLASILFTMAQPQEWNSVELKNVMVINGNGDSLGVTITNLEWNNKTLLTTNTDEQRSFVLGQNFPNPFNPSTILTYRLNTAAQVRLSVYDITGREVSRLIDQYQYAGEYNVKWDSNSNNGQKMASGMYVARLNVDNSSVSRKMLLTK
ncbi:MAG: FlgD immunoglobulin-like domain containing protein [Bacteroidota bacterium]